MVAQVLGATLLFVIVVGLVLRFFTWLSRRQREGSRAKAEAWLEQATKPADVKIEHKAKPQPVTPAAVAAAVTAPPPPVQPAASIPPTATVAKEPAPIESTVALQAMKAGPAVATANGPTRPSIAATLAPGASATPKPVFVPPFKRYVSLPAHILPAKVAATLQPAGATWTPPPAPAPRDAAPAPPTLPAPIVAPTVGPLVIDRPSVAGTLPLAAASVAPTPVAVAAPPATTTASVSTAPAAAPSRQGPSIIATLAPGAALRQPPPAAPPKAPEPRPSHIPPVEVAATLQPAGATWTPPPVATRGEPAAANPPPTIPALVRPNLGPVEIVAPSVGGTLANFAGAAPEAVSTAAMPITIAFTTPDVGANPQAPVERPARSLSAGAIIAAPTFRMATARPAPTPRPAPPAWAIVAIKTSLPFRVRRPATRLISGHARDVVLHSKSKGITKVLGRHDRLRSPKARRPTHH